MTSISVQEYTGPVLSDRAIGTGLELFSCPADGGLLRLEDPVREGHRVRSGRLVCRECGTAYPIRECVPRFVPSDDYAGSFSFEWTTHNRTQLDHAARRVSEETFREKTGLTPADVRGKTVLDVGCGMGRFADVIVKWGGRVVGVDLSLAVDSAHRNLGAHPQFQAAQASVFDLPFRPGTFDLIYSLGVLHHTPDCERAFKALPRLLKPGGRIVIWVYSAHTYRPDGVEEARDRLLRRWTTRMNPRLLHALCRAAGAVRPRGRAWLHMLLPGFVFHALPRVPAYADRQWRVLDTFDWYSPRYQSKHTYPEVCRWFREAGLTDIRPLDFEVTVIGTRPEGPSAG